MSLGSKSLFAFCVAGPLFLILTLFATGQSSEVLAAEQKVLPHNLRIAKLEEQIKLMKDEMTKDYRAFDKRIRPLEKSTIRNFFNCRFDEDGRLVLTLPKNPLQVRLVIGNTNFELHEGGGFFYGNPEGVKQFQTK